MTPTARSLKNLEAAGYTAAVVEHWNAFAHIRQDLFGFADILAFKPGEVLLVQTTTKSNASARIKKIKANDTATAWLAAGNKIVVHGWHQAKKGGRWAVKEIPITK